MTLPHRRLSCSRATMVMVGCLPPIRILTTLSRIELPNGQMYSLPTICPAQPLELSTTQLRQ